MKITDLSTLQLERLVARLLEARGYVVHLSRHPNYPHWSLVAYGSDNSVIGIAVHDENGSAGCCGQHSIDQMMEALTGEYTDILEVIARHSVDIGYEANSEIELYTPGGKHEVWDHRVMVNLIHRHQNIAHHFGLTLSDNPPPPISSEDERDILLYLRGRRSISKYTQIDTESGKCALIQEIGRGAFGTVWEGRMDTGGEELKRCAIKIFHPHAYGDSESKLLSNLKHENIIRSYGHGTSVTGEQFLAMELGVSISRRMDLGPDGKGTPLREDLAVRFARDAATGLAYLHDAGYVHRDIKPHNMIVCQDEIVKLGDFGISRQIHRTLTTHTGQGTSAYLAPEVTNFSGPKFSRSSDIWALGVSLHQLLNGELPFRDVSSIYSLSISEPRERYRSELDVLIRKCLQHDVGSRINALDLATELMDLLSSASIGGSRGD